MASEAGRLVLRLGPEGKAVFPLTHFDRDLFLYEADAEMPGFPSALRFAIGPDGKATALTAECSTARPRNFRADGVTWAPGRAAPAPRDFYRT